MKRYLFGETRKKTKSKTKPKTPQRFNMNATYKGKRRYELDYNNIGMYVHDNKTGETKFYSVGGKIDGKVIKSRSGENWNK